MTSLDRIINHKTLTNFGMVSKHDQLGQELLTQGGFRTLAKFRRGSKKRKEAWLLAKHWLLIFKRVLVLRH